MPNETTPKAKTPRKPRRNFQKLVESTALFCEISISTCEEFKGQDNANSAVNISFDAQIRVYRRILQMLSGDSK